MEKLLEEKTVEPNSGLGQDINYMLATGDPLTLVLREPGAPLDNNLVEQALKNVSISTRTRSFIRL